MLRGIAPERRTRVALREAVIAFGVLMAFMLGGQTLPTAIAELRHFGGEPIVGPITATAYMRKVGAPVRVGEGGRPTEWAGVGPADYQGMLADGRAVAVEAKSEAGRLQRDAIKAHQRRDLERPGLEQLAGTLAHRRPRREHVVDEEHGPVLYYVSNRRRTDGQGLLAADLRYENRLLKLLDQREIQHFGTTMMSPCSTPKVIL